MSQDRTAIVIHGHFYQPPRENPWTGIVEREPSAAPFHDWNERIYEECYRRNAYARIVDDQSRAMRIVNNYRGLSFNFGPTLAAWLTQNHPRTWARIVEADAKSVEARGGHGNAIAQGYNHTILPLCNEHDLRTQIRWGLGEFAYRFGRPPEALWMPETACNARVLGALIDEGLRYAILAPGQAARVRAPGSDAWQDVSDGSVDPRRAYRYSHPDGSGRTIALFFYDGAISRAIAFERLLASSHDLVSRFEGAAGGAGTLLQAVTDGESYGHHFPSGERCLAYTLETEAERRGFWVTNYGQWLDHYPAEYEADIKPGDDGYGTSWSCVHGVGRWHADCGCSTGGKAGWNQRWRKPLRDALDLLRDEAADAYERLTGDLAGEPWALRDAYIELLVDPTADRAAFFEREVGRRLSESAQVRLLRLLEMQRSSMLMYTSCGWFFSDISGIETIQILRYSGRLLHQLERLGVSCRARFLEALAEAHSNVPTEGNGADVFRRHVTPARVPNAAIAAHIGINSLAADLPEQGEVAQHRYTLRDMRKNQAGRLRLATCRVRLDTIRTGEERDYGLAALHFGGIDVYCVLRPFDSRQDFIRATERLWAEFDTASLLTILRVAEEEFGPEEYGLEHVLAGGRDAVARAILAESLARYADQYERLYEDNRRLIAMFGRTNLPLPDELRVAAEITLTRRLEQELEQQRDRSDAASYRRAVAIANEAQRYGFGLRCTEGKARFEAMVETLVRRVVEDDGPGVGPELIESALELLELTDSLSIAISLERAQELLYEGIVAGIRPDAAVQKLLLSLGFSETVVGRPTAGVPDGPGSRRPTLAP